MSFAIDAIILFSAVIILWSGAHKGFIRSIMSLLGTVASLFVAYAYTPVLSTYIGEKFMTDRVTNGIEETLRSLAFDTTTDMYNLDRLAVDLPKPFTDILDRYGIEIQSFAAKLRGITGCDENVVRNFSEEIASPTANMLSSILAFLLLFVAAFIALSLITSLLDLIFSLPVLKKANTFLGFVLGGSEAILVSFALSLALSALVTSLGSIDPGLFGADVVDQTIICKWLIANNPLDSIISALFR